MKKAISLFILFIFLGSFGFSYYTSYCYYRVEYVPFFLRLYYFSYTWGTVDFEWVLEYRPVLVRYCERYWYNDYRYYDNYNYYHCRYRNNYERFYHRGWRYSDRRVLNKRILTRKKFSDRRLFTRKKYTKSKLFTRKKITNRKVFVRRKRR